MNSIASMRRIAAALLGLTMGLSLCAVTRPAHADADSDAQDLFVRGRDLREKGDLAGAVTLFRKANALAPTRLGSLRNVAECEEQLGHYASARRAWLELKRQLLTSHETKYETWSKDAEDAAARLLPKVAQLTLEVIVKRPDGEGPVMATQGQGGAVEITINGEALPLALAATTLDRDPGHYDIRVAGKDVEAPATQSLDLTAGAAKTVKLRVILRPPPPPDAPVILEHMHPRRVAGFITLGFGAASLLASSVTFALRAGAMSDLETQCPKYETQPCKRSVSSIVSKGETMSTLTTVFLISGGVLAATGLTLVLASPDVKEPSSVNAHAHAKVPLRLTPALGGLMLDGGFQ